MSVNADERLSRLEYHKFFDDWQNRFHGEIFADPNKPIPDCDTEQIPQSIEDVITDERAKKIHFPVNRAQSCCTRLVLIWEDRNEYTIAQGRRKPNKNRRLASKEMEDIQRMVTKLSVGQQPRTIKAGRAGREDERGRLHGPAPTRAAERAYVEGRHMTGRDRDRDRDRNRVVEDRRDDHSRRRVDERSHRRQDDKPRVREDHRSEKQRAPEHRSQETPRRRDDRPERRC